MLITDLEPNIQISNNNHRGGLDLGIRLNSGPKYQVSEKWTVAGRDIRFLCLAPHAFLELDEGIHYVKVMTGRLALPDRGCFAEPFLIRNTLVSGREIVAGSEGASFALLTEHEKTPGNLNDMDQLRFDGAKSEALKWYSFEEKFGRFTGFFDGKDCHMMDGLHLIEESGVEFTYVNFWTCGQGVNLSAHNHAGDPSDMMPAFAEVHWVINAGTGLGGMFRANDEGVMGRVEPLSRGDEHGPYFEFDKTSRKPELRENGAVKYGWHGWQGGENNSKDQQYDLVAAFEIHPDYALV